MEPSSTVPPQANFDFRSEDKLSISTSFGSNPFDDRYLFSVAALVDADGDLLRLFGNVLADAEFLREPARRADFRHYNLSVQDGDIKQYRESSETIPSAISTACRPLPAHFAAVRRSRSRNVASRLTRSVAPIASRYARTVSPILRPR